MYECRCLVPALRVEAHAKPTRADWRGSFGGGVVLFFHHPWVLGLVTVTCYFLLLFYVQDIDPQQNWRPCYFRFVCSFPLGSPLNSVQIIPASPLVWAPSLGLWKPANLSPCLEPLILLRRRITPPAEDSKALPTSLSTLQPRSAFFSYPCLHQALCLEGSPKALCLCSLAYRPRFLQEAFLRCAHPSTTSKSEGSSSRRCTRVFHSMLLTMHHKAGLPTRRAGPR